jgi:hypothetical protein
MAGPSPNILEGSALSGGHRPQSTMRIFRPLRRRIERLGPYPSLVLLAVPTAIVEPLKLLAVFIAGKGHWITGTIAGICAYAFSLLVLERLFVVVKPKLLTIPWFAAIWKWIVRVRGKALTWLRAKWTLGRRALSLSGQ